MYAPNDNTAPKGLRGWWAAPPRSGMRRMISPWERTSRSFSIGAILVVVSLVLVGCTSGPSKTAGRETSTSESGKSSTSTTVTSVPAAKLIEPSGPVSARPALLDEASAACRRAGASDITLCAGTVDAEVWGLPLVIMSNLRDLLACQFRLNVLDNATTLAGPDSTSVAYPNDDTL